MADQLTDPNWAYNSCCGNCGPGLCYIDQITGAADEGHAWEYHRG